MLTYQEPLDLKRLIKESKYTQQDIARHMKVNRQTLNTWINGDLGELSLNQLVKICSKLNLDLKWCISPS